MIGVASGFWLLLSGVEVQAVQQETLVTIELRVASVRPRQVVVDRGMTDGLLAKDRVTFRPRDGRIAMGTVVAAYERDALVELDDPSVVLVPGTKGDVKVPGSRRRRERRSRNPPRRSRRPRKPPSPRIRRGSVRTRS